MYGNEVKKDLLGNPIPDAVPFSMTPHDQNAATANGHGGNIAGVVAIANEMDEHTKAKKLAAEIDDSIRNIEGLSKGAADKLPRASGSMTAAQLEAVKAEVAKVENELAAKEAQKDAQKIIGGLFLAGGGGAALLAGAGKGSVLPDDLLPQGRGDRASPEKNEKFERLLAGLDNKMFADPRNMSGEDYGTLAPIKGIPNFVAIAKAMEKPTERQMALG